MTTSGSNKDDDNDDVWDVFGSDHDDDDGDDDGVITTTTTTTTLTKCPTASTANDALSVANFWVQTFLHANPQVPLRKRKLLMIIGSLENEAESTVFQKALHRKQLECITRVTNIQELQEQQQNVQEEIPQFDGCMVFCEDKFVNTLFKKEVLDSFAPFLVLGGHLLCIGTEGTNDEIGIVQQQTLLNSSIWNPSTLKEIPSTKSSSIHSVIMIHISKWETVLVQTDQCRWLPTKFQKDSTPERQRLCQATVVLSVAEMDGNLTEHSLQKAARCITEYGYCIVPGLLYHEKQHILKVGQAVLQDLHQAAQILKDTEQVDLYHPNDEKNPASYRELSMREDFRMDVRDGPALREIRQCNNNNKNGNQPITVTGSTKELPNDFLRGNANVLEILRRAMNPKDEFLARGNFGRFNFGGSGPDGSYQDLYCGIVGGIVSLPGAADQALHADTPHLFESYKQLPPHYINVFTPGVNATQGVGQTAIIHASHSLEFTAKYCSSSSTMLSNGTNNANNDNHDDSNNNSYLNETLWEYLVRPELHLGDVLFFDCRVLHFGMSNTSRDGVERPVLYTNTTMHWFRDPKNWNDQKPIFSQK